MPVPTIDLSAIWHKGQNYNAWLESCDPKHRDEMSALGSSIQIPVPTAQKLSAISREVHILAISEDWCGDVRRNIPVLARLCTLNPRFKLRVAPKEADPNLMGRYLTNGAEAIPKFIFLNAQFVEVGNWGPRPGPCKRLMARGKAAGKVDQAREQIRAFYASDKAQTAIAELAELFETASTEAV